MPSMPDQKPTLDYGTREPRDWLVWVWVSRIVGIAIFLYVAVLL
jgi:hypothetical protein